MPTTTLLATPLPADLVAEARALVREILDHDDPRALRREGAELVLRLTRAGLDAFFLEPIARLGLGAVTRSMVKVGLGSAAKAIGVFVHRIVGGLDADQIRTVAELVDGMLIDVEE